MRQERSLFTVNNRKRAEAKQSLSLARMIPVLKISGIKNIPPIKLNCLRYQGYPMTNWRQINGGNPTDIFRL